MKKIYLLAFAAGVLLGAYFAARGADDEAGAKVVLTGQAAFADFRSETPGVFRRITPADLPKPYATLGAANPPKLVPRPSDVWPQAASGFKVQLYAAGLENPRLIRTAPNGDVFVASSSVGKINVLRGTTPDGKTAQISEYATGLQQPFGIAFYPPGPNPEYVYVANTGSVVRFPYSERRSQGPRSPANSRRRYSPRRPSSRRWTLDS